MGERILMNNWKRVSKLSKEEIDALCVKYSVSLPEDYRSSIGDINGGGLISSYVNVKGIGDVAYSRNITLVDDKRGNAFSLFNVLDEGSKKYFPFGDVGNGDYFCFDLKKNQVVLYSHETQETFFVCNTFTEFLKMIIDE